METPEVRSALEVFDYKNLTTSQHQKAEKLISLGCVKPETTKGNGLRFQILPIKGYNKSTYMVYYNFKLKQWSCTCFYYRSKKRACAHILACDKLMGLENVRLKR